MATALFLPSTGSNLCTPRCTRLVVLCATSSFLQVDRGVPQTISVPLFSLFPTQLIPCHAFGSLLLFKEIGTSGHQGQAHCRNYTPLLDSSLFLSLCLSLSLFLSSPPSLPSLFHCLSLSISHTLFPSLSLSQLRESLKCWIYLNPPPPLPLISLCLEGRFFL